MTVDSRHDLTLLLCEPRGFCAGVDRAVQIVEQALKKFGAPVYVRHEIVHNRFVVDNLKTKGAIFVNEIAEIPDTDRPVIFSAHGVAKKVKNQAMLRNMLQIDATCPLVVKVHSEAEHHWRNGLEVILIGHGGHPEVIGTMGQLPPGAITLIESIDDINNFKPKNPDKLAYITQTTLSVSDTAALISELKGRFPSIKGPVREDICYATTNRQAATKMAAIKSDAMIIVGAENSSNSQRLWEVAIEAGCRQSFLVSCVDDITWSELAGVKIVGITAGASAPEFLVEDIIAAFDQVYNITIENIRAATENVVFKTPKILRDIS